MMQQRYLQWAPCLLCNSLVFIYYACSPVLWVPRGPNVIQKVTHRQTKGCRLIFRRVDTWNFCGMWQRWLNLFARQKNCQLDKFSQASLFDLGATIQWKQCDISIVTSHIVQTRLSGGLNSCGAMLLFAKPIVFGGRGWHLKIDFQYTSECKQRTKSAIPKSKNVSCKAGN